MQLKHIFIETHKCRAQYISKSGEVKKYDTRKYIVSAYEIERKFCPITNIVIFATVSIYNIIIPITWNQRSILLVVASANKLNETQAATEIKWFL